jgi:predicted  nucleic acid-binding Zn-ribbon protein
MTENVENLLLEHLKALRNEFHSETENLKQRMSALETAMINVKREVNAGDETDARHQVQIDQLVERIRRIENAPRSDLTLRPRRGEARFPAQP